MRAMIFDFDGVILESADIKTRAFVTLFQEHPEQVEEIKAYHLRNMGLSRFVKFRHIYDNILKRPLSAEEEHALGERFSQIALDEILAAPFVKGAQRSLATLSQKMPLFVASGTPQEELEWIAEQRGVKGYFCEIHGSPRKKPEIVRDILERYRLEPCDVVFIGDAESDKQAAEATGTHFVARLSGENDDLLGGCPRRVRDLDELLELRWE